MTTPLRCLMVEDSEDDARLVLRQLRAGGYEVISERVDTPEAMRAALDRQPWDTVISDYAMPCFSGLAALELLKASGLDLPFIIVSGTIGEDTAVEAMRQGAHDYLMKGNLARLAPAVQRELRDAVERQERKLAESALHLQIAALTAAANSIVITDREGTIAWVNPAFAALTGYTLAEAVGKNPRDLVKSGRQDRATYQDLWETVLAGRVWQGELINRRKNGTFYPEEMTITPVLDASGVITHFIAIKQDLTERVTAEKILRQSERRLRTLVQTIPDLVWLKDSHGVFLFCNSAFEHFLGTPETSIVGRTDHELVSKSLADSFRAHDRAAAAAGGPTANEEWLTFANGYRGLFQTIKTPMCDADGTLVGVLGVARDITERQQAVEALRLQAEQLCVRNATLERFNAVAVGRELRMIELKHEVNGFCGRLGKPPRYQIAKSEPAPLGGAGDTGVNQRPHHPINPAGTARP